MNGGNLMVRKALLLLGCALALAACGEPASDDTTPATRPGPDYSFSCDGAYGVYEGPTGIAVVPNHTNC